MVKKYLLLAVISTAVAACGHMPSVDVQYDYPGKVTGKSKVINAKPKEEASVPKSVVSDATVTESGSSSKGLFTIFGTGKASDEVTATPAFEWPIKDVGKYLNEYKAGQSASAVEPKEGKTVSFRVMSEYKSANNDACKRYSVEEKPYLACFGQVWYPVRSFEE